MRIIFAGTPDFSVPALAALISAGHEIVAVYTQPDRRAGRGRQTTPGPVKQFALDNQLTIEQPVSLKNQAGQLSNYQADIMVVVAYGIILPQDILEIPKYGCLNIHASLLPRWRGAAPIQRAIEAGDRETGITIMQMDAGLDTGDMLARYPVMIEESDTAQSLHDRLSETGAQAIVEVLADLDQFLLQATRQDSQQASYAKKISKEEADIDWEQECEQLQRKVRAFNPWPGTQTWYQGTRLRIWQAQAVNGTCHGRPGEILAADSSGITVACGRGCLRILQLQRAGGKPMKHADFLNGTPLQTGQLLSMDNG